MRKKDMWPKIILSLLIFCNAFSSSTFAQNVNTTALNVFQKVRDSIFLLGDGKNFTYGIYLAGARNKKFVYMLGANQLSVGIENKMRFTSLDGKTKEFDAEKLRSDEDLNIAVYIVKTSPKDLETITKHPNIAELQNTSQWVLGTPANPRNMARVRIESISPDWVLLDSYHSSGAVQARSKSTTTPR